MEFYKTYFNKHYRLSKIETYGVNGVICIKDFKIIDLETGETIMSHYFYLRLSKILGIDDVAISELLDSIALDKINQDLSNQITIDYD